MWISFEENFFCCAVAAEGGHASTWVVVNNTCAGNLTARGDYFAARVFGLRNCLPSSWRKRRLTGLVKNYGPTRNRIKMNVCHIGSFEKYLKLAWPNSGTKSFSR